MRYTSDDIKSLKKNEVFVFGSNLNGNHSGGAAAIAVEKFGAIMGQARGLQGKSYGIVKLVKTEKVDGKKIKENVWYKLESGKFVETLV